MSAMRKQNFETDVSMRPDPEQQVIVDLARLSLSSISVADLNGRYELADDGTLIVRDSDEDFDAYQAVLSAQN